MTRFGVSKPGHMIKCQYDDSILLLACGTHPILMFQGLSQAQGGSGGQTNVLGGFASSGWQMDKHEVS